MQKKLIWKKGPVIYQGFMPLKSPEDIQPNYSIAVVYTNPPRAYLVEDFDQEAAIRELKAYYKLFLDNECPAITITKPYRYIE